MKTSEKEKLLQELEKEKSILEEIIGESNELITRYNKLRSGKSKDEKFERISKEEWESYDNANFKENEAPRRYLTVLREIACLRSKWKCFKYYVNDHPYISSGTGSGIIYGAKKLLDWWLESPISVGMFWGVTKYPVLFNIFDIFIILVVFYITSRIISARIAIEEPKFEERACCKKAQY